MAGRKRRSPKYSYDAVKVLQRVWAASGMQCRKYLAVSMRIQIDGLERHGNFVDGVDRYGPAVRRELLAMSAASIDRYLKPARDDTLVAVRRQTWQRHDSAGRSEWNCACRAARMTSSP